jgi:hypothetical protein
MGGNSISAALVVALLSVCLPACTIRRIADLRLEGVDVVERRPTRGCELWLDDGFDCDGQRPGLSLRVRVSTEVDLIDLASRYELNTWSAAGPCPIAMEDGNPFGAQGPYREGVRLGMPFGDDGAAELYRATGGAPLGRHDYTVYIPIQGTGQRGSINSPAFELAQAPTSICMILGGGNMAGMRAVSEPAVIEQDLVRDALTRRPTSD